LETSSVHHLYNSYSCLFRGIKKEVERMKREGLEGRERKRKEKKERE
jgi:lantibiotic modifying enzyme